MKDATRACQTTSSPGSSLPWKCNLCCHADAQVGAEGMLVGRNGDCGPWREKVRFCAVRQDGAKDWTDHSSTGRWQEVQCAREWDSWPHSGFPWLYRAQGR